MQNHLHSSLIELYKNKQMILLKKATRKGGTERKITMKYYVIGTRKYTNAKHTDFTDEWTAYQGFDYEEAKKALAEEQSNYECYSTKQEKATHEVFGEVYELPDDLDTSDNDAIINALCDCCCCDDFE